MTRTMTSHSERVCRTDGCDNRVSGRQRFCPPCADERIAVSKRAWDTRRRREFGARAGICRSCGTATENYKQRMCNRCSPLWRKKYLRLYAKGLDDPAGYMNSLRDQIFMAKDAGKPRPEEYKDGSLERIWWDMSREERMIVSTLFS